MASAAIPNEIGRRIAQFSSTSTLFTLTLVNRNFYTLAEILLYRLISLPFPQALLFFRTLQSKPVLGSYVRSLHLHQSGARHEGEIFRAALASMTRLRRLYIMGPVDFQCVLSSLHTSLVTLRYGLPVTNRVRQFLARHRTIRILSLYHPLGMQSPMPLDFLPNLREIEAQPDDVFTLIDGSAVHSVKFRYPVPWDVPLLHRACFESSLVPITELDCMAYQLVDFDQLDLFLPALKKLVVRPDIMWGLHESTNDYPPLVNRLVRKLARLRDLRLLVVVTPYQTCDVEPFQHAINRHITHFTHFHRFVFHTHNRCISWDDFLARRPISKIQSLNSCRGHCLPSSFQ
ncbi:hypothetical protein R3P38DRAFT_3320663 [Favolaschia claudopus]|uniref:F-box domain-containing protein n=1 Tax=Favolaschia claudopus TaxID=2862362 RepID=A0AAW0AYN3_9AGAR